MLIPGFCFFLEKYWEDMPWDLDIVANVERIRLEALPYNKIYVGDDYGLSSNLIAYLNRLPESEKIVLLLDDYYLAAPPDTELLEKIIGCMEAHEDIGYINLGPWSDDLLCDGGVTRTYTDWHRAYQNGDRNSGLTAGQCPGGLGYYDVSTAEYLLSFQPGIWLAGFLKGLLREREDGWEAEKEGTKRARTADKWMLGTFFHPIPHHNIARYGIWREWPDSSTSRDWIVKEVGTKHWIYKELSALLGGEGLR